MDKILATFEIDRLVEELKFEDAFEIFSEYVSSFSQFYLNKFFSNCVNGNFYKGAIFAWEHGARVDEAEVWTLLFRTIQCQNLPLIDFLITSSKIDLNVSHSTDIEASRLNYLLSLSTAYATPEIVEYFLSKGADIHYCDNHPFIFACSHHNLATMKHIYNNYPTDVNLYNSFTNITPLNWACVTHFFRIPETVNFLLDKGAKIDDETLDIIVKQMDTNFLVLFADKINFEQAGKLPALMLKYINKDEDYYKFPSTFVSTVEKIINKLSLEQELILDKNPSILKKNKI